MNERERGECAEHGRRYQEQMKMSPFISYQLAGEGRRRVEESRGISHFDLK